MFFRRPIVLPLMADLIRPLPALIPLSVKATALGAWGATAYLPVQSGHSSTAEAVGRASHTFGSPTPPRRLSTFAHREDPRHQPPVLARSSFWLLLGHLKDRTRRTSNPYTLRRAGVLRPSLLRTSVQPQGPVILVC